MLPISIVILSKNEELNIARCVNSVKGLTAEILVIDSGSTDKTIPLAISSGAKVIDEIWKGYSETKNIGNEHAAHDWILSLDADEEMNPELRSAIESIFSKEIKVRMAFCVRRKMVYCGKVLHHGSQSWEYRKRLFNRQTAHWNHNDVHEDLDFSVPMKIKKLKGFLWHHSYNTSEEHRERLEKYAQMSATQLSKKGKKATFIKRYLSPAFGFIKNFIFKGGFLDGKKGFQFALNEMWYVKRKYQLLKALS